MTDITHETTYVSHTGVYRGIPFEIREPFKHYAWVYYVHISIDRIEDKKLAESLWFDPTKTEFGTFYIMPNGVIDEIDFHGGCTYYGKQYGRQGERIVRLGCDYNHYWDSENEYSVDWLKNDIRNTIDSIHKLMTFQEIRK